MGALEKRSILEQPHRALSWASLLGGGGTVTPWASSTQLEMPEGGRGGGRYNQGPVAWDALGGISLPSLGPKEKTGYLIL